jgi:hypothetical protein
MLEFYHAVCPSRVCRAVVLAAILLHVLTAIATAPGSCNIPLAFGVGRFKRPRGSGRSPRPQPAFVPMQPRSKACVLTKNQIQMQTRTNWADRAGR